MWPKLTIILMLVQYLNANCDVCLSGSVACHSENTYSICIKGKPTGRITTCPNGFVCTGENFICYPDVERTPICHPGQTSTTEEIEDLNRSFCSVQNKVGNYKNDNDPTCKTFISCSIVNNNWFESEESCVKKTPYFNGIKCQAAKPDDCV